MCFSYSFVMPIHFDFSTDYKHCGSKRDLVYSVSPKGLGIY